MVIRQQLRHSKLLMFDSFWFPGDKIPRPDGSVDGRLRSRLESHPEDVPNHGSQGFGLNGIWWAFDNLPAQACSAECLFHCRPSPRILPQLECILEYAFDVFCHFILNRHYEVDALHRHSLEWRSGHEASCQTHRRYGWSRDHQRALVDEKCRDVTGHPDMSSVEKAVVDPENCSLKKKSITAVTGTGSHKRTWKILVIARKSLGGPKVPGSLVWEFWWLVDGNFPEIRFVARIFGRYDVSARFICNGHVQQTCQCNWYVSLDMQWKCRRNSYSTTL